MFSARALRRPRAGRLFYLCMGPPRPPSFPCHVPPHTVCSRPSSLRGFSCHPLPSDSCLPVKAQLRWYWLHCEDGPGPRPELRTSSPIWLLLAFLFFWLSGPTVPLATFSTADCDALLNVLTRLDQVLPPAPRSCCLNCPWIPEPSRWQLHGKQ